MGFEQPHYMTVFIFMKQVQLSEPRGISRKGHALSAKDGIVFRV